MCEWINVNDRLPKCSRKADSNGIEVIIWPRCESGEATAFFGRRVTDKPNFYRHGAIVNGVMHWSPLPEPPKDEPAKWEAPFDGHCGASKDGECSKSWCPQIRDSEPNKSGRHCPLDQGGDDD